LYLEDNVDYKVILKDADGNIVTTQDDVLCPTRPGTPQTALELANGITPTDVLFEPGNVFRYGAVADSGVGSQGTDNTTAFQNAINSGHKVYVPNGYYSIENTLEVFSTTNYNAIHMEMSSGVRMEKFSNNADPMIHVVGESNKIEGNGATLAQRNYGGLTKGLVLLGPDPDVTATTDNSATPTRTNWISDLFIIGKTSVTGWDGSVGFYGESAARKRGQFLTPVTYPSYYNTIVGVYVTQFDYGFFGSTDFNANSFTGCGVTSFGHSAVALNGYANQFTDVKVEKGDAQDTTERFTFLFGNKGSGPEANQVACDYDATSYTITGVTKGATTKLLTSADPTSTVNAGDLAAALNGGTFECTAVDAAGITISVDTSGDSATWSSGGTALDGIYPLLGARANQIQGFVETGYSASTQVVRLVGCTVPTATYATTNVEGVYGRNVVRISGTPVGGIGKDGFSTRASLLNNIVDVTSVGFTDWARQARLQDFTVQKLDTDDTVDGVQSGWGSKYHRTFAGRMANMNNVTQPTTYTVLTVDNVGITSASILIQLSYVFKEAANSDHEAGEISWLCPVYASDGQTPIKFKDFQANDNGASQPYLTWSVVEGTGTAASTGKFELKVTMADVTGSDNGFCTWVATVLHDNVDQNGMDWAADVTIQNGGLSDTGGAE
jgi:hypothetical protein